MKIYTLTITYNSDTSEVYSIEESIDEDRMEYIVNGTDLSDIMDTDSNLWNKLMLQATEVGEA